MPDFIHLIILAGFIYFATLLFLLTGFFKIRNSKTAHKPTVSVIVAARNEEKNIKNCLNALLSQTYPKELVQLVIVNDRSADGTADILKSFAVQHKNLHTITITETPSGMSPKKFALTNGIKQASGELIFATDADCTPPPGWLSGTTELFQDAIGLVIGPAPFADQKTLLSKLLCVENFATAFVSAGATGWGSAITCAGRNLAYRKSVFEEVDGFHTINHSLSGDDDLFLQTVKKQTDWKIVYSINAETAVPSPAAKSFSAYISQRRRHVSASKYYSKPIQAGYLLFNLANLALFGFFFFSLVKQDYLIIAAPIFAAKLALDFLCLFLITKKLAQQSLLRHFLLWEIFFLFNQMLISPLGLIGRVKWK